MSTVVSRSAPTWAAAHRTVLALVVAAIALAATILVVLTTSADSSPPASVQAPDQGQTAPQLPGPAQPQNPGTPDIPKNCLHHMGLQYMALVPC